MSRSRRPQCSVGRGCGCCGDAGAVRRRRERDHQLADDQEAAYIGDDAKATGHPFHHDSHYPGRRHPS